jgi:flagellar biosynthesis protein FlhB
LAATSTLLFQTLSPNIFFFSNKRKEKKTIEKKRNVEKGGSFPSSSHFTISFLAFIFALSLLSFYFKRFLLASSSSQATENEKKKKKTIKKKKMQRKEGAYLQILTLPSHFWLPLLASCFYFFVSNDFSLASSSSQAEEKKEKHTKKKNAKKGGNLPFFSCFCIWDEAFLLLFLLHIPSMLSFPPSLNFVCHIFSKFCATQA